MSDDEEIDLSESSDGDFSASEDEWVPNKKYKPSSDSEQEIDSDFEESPKDTKRKSKTKSAKGGRQLKKKPLTLRTKLFNKYKPIPKTLNSTSRVIPGTVQDILERARFQKQKSLAKSTEESSQESDSSGDEHLVNPNELDLASSFFDPLSNKDLLQKETTPPPTFDCNAGAHLSDASDNDENDLKEPQSPKKSETFENFINYTKRIATAKENLESYNEKKSTKTDHNDDVTALLAMGESSTSTILSKNIKISKSTKKRGHHDSESDWEEVEENTTPSTSSLLADGALQIAVELPSELKKNRKDVDVEACLKRKINRVKKENQLALHKVNLLSWIAHGNYVNRVLNHPHLMTLSLKLLPSAHCYPKERADIKYFEQITKWYKTIIKIENEKMYNTKQSELKLPASLAMQIKAKSASCVRDAVLMFVILLRALGIQARMVLNLVTAPIRPPTSELCKISLKKSDASEKEKNVKDVVEKSKQTDNTKHKSKKVKVDDDYSEKESKHTDTKYSPKKLRSSQQEKTDNNSKTSKLESKIKNKKIDKKSHSSSNNQTKKEIKSSHFSDKNKNEKKNDMKKKTDGSSKITKPTNLSQKLSNSKTVDKSKSEKTSKSQRARDKRKTSVGSKSKTLPSSSGSSKAITKEITSPHFSNDNEKMTRNDRKKNSNKTEKKDNQQSSSSSTYRRGRSKKSSDVIPQVDGGDDKPTLTPKKISRTRTKTPTSSSANSLPKREGNYKPTFKIKPIKSFNVNASFVCHLSEDERNSSPVIESKKMKPPSISKSNLVKPSTSNGIEKSSKSRDLAKKSNQSKRAEENNIKKNISTTDDEDFVSSPRKKIKTTEEKSISNPSLDKLKKIDRRVISTDDEDGDNGKYKSNKIDIWIELYSEVDEKWITVDFFKGKVDCVDKICKTATSPIAYVLAWNNDNSIKDVSPRYCTLWNTVTRKLRVEKEWLDKALKRFLGTKTKRDKNEDEELNKIHLDKPLPTTISEYKNHPLYVLQRHLLKFESLYPPNPLILGYCRNEPVYARECVHTLHSREIWVKQAKVVKPGETPYKIVKARPKWDKYNNTVIKDQPLEVFGFWQTQDYEPPVAENGVVPRNAYGNVELFKPQMLPINTVHLQLAGLNKTCKKLGIDCAPAVVGFDFHSGYCHPTFDGFVICEEFAEKAVAAWLADEEEAERKEQEKYEKRVYGNWKKLIKGLWIRERLQRKYNFQDKNDEVNG